VERAGQLVGTCACGLAFGAADSFVNAISSPYQSLGSTVVGTAWAGAAEVASLLLDAGWSWAALGVTAGWAAGTLIRGMVAGTTALIAATIAYFCCDAALRGEPVSVVEMGFWGIAALILGPMLGAVGDRIRQPRVQGAIAGLVVPVVAAIQMVLQPPGLARTPSGWIPNPEADLARLLVWGLAALATIIVLGRFARGTSSGIHETAPDHPSP
jgi:hypothetical protein